MQQAFQEWILLAGKIEILFQIKICREVIISIADWRLQIADFRFHNAYYVDGFEFPFF